MFLLGQHTPFGLVLVSMEQQLEYFFLFHETFSMLQIFFLTMIVIGIIGIKILGGNA